jgi:hypothetical protein
VRKHLRMRVIPEPEPNTRAVLVNTGQGTIVIGGQGTTTYVCGACESPLAVNVEEGVIRSLVLRCKGCDAFNEFPT